MDDDFGVLLADQALGQFGGRFRDHDDDGDLQLSPGVGDGDAGVAAGGGDEAGLSRPRVVFAGGADAAQLERAGGLQRVQLQPDRAAGQGA